MPRPFRRLRRFFTNTLGVLTGGLSRPSSPGRRPRQVRLGFEQLEARELLSASASGFSLNGGNLYNTTGVQAQLIDTGVQTFTLSGGKVYDLHAGGALTCMNADGTGKTSLTTSGNPAVGGTTYAMDAAGDLFTLDSNKNLAVNGVNSLQAQALYQGYDQSGTPVVYAYQNGVLRQYILHADRTGTSSNV